MEKTKNAIAFMNHQRSGCFWYRIEHPMNALKRSGIDVRLLNINEDFDDEEISTFQFYGAYPFSIAPALQYLKSQGKKIVYDTDDALDLVDPVSPFYKSVQKDLGSATEILQFADEVTVSTPEMKKYIEGKYNGKITVIPNYFFQSEWTFPRPKREGIRIGYSGSPSHIGDLITILPAIKKLQDKYKIEFFLHGFGGPKSDYGQWFKDHRFVSTPEGIEELYTLDKLLSDIKFGWVPFTDYADHPNTLTNMALDIGIAVIKDTPFNKCRSAIKSYEYTLSGALCLSSNRTPYTQEPTSILVDDNQWEEQIEFFINNPIIREKARCEHLKWIRENRDIMNNIDLLKSVYVI